MNASVTVASIVIPTYNEAKNIIPLLEAIHAALGSLAHEIIVVDDDSPDKTWEIAASFAQGNPWIRVHRRVGARGLSSAVLAGFALAKGDVLGVMDGDCSHDPAILPALIGAVRAGAQLAVGSRRIPGGGATDWPWIRRRMSDLATGLARALLDLPLSDPMSGYFIVSRAFYEACRSRIQPLGYKILLSFYCAGHPVKICELPYIFRTRHQGHSKVNLKVLAYFVLMLWRERRASGKAASCAS